MKQLTKSDLAILTIAVILIVLGIANLDNLLNVVILVGTALFIVIYVIVTVRGKNALERKIEFNKGKFNIANRERVELINKYSELEKEANINTQTLINQAEGTITLSLERYEKEERERIDMFNAHVDLIDEYNQLEIDFAKQVEETADVEYKLEILREQYIELGLDLANATSKTVIGKNMFNDKEIVETKIDQSSEPFTEEIKQCPICGADMRETKCYWICDNCKKRIRKEK